MMSENRNVLVLNHDVNNQLGIAMGNFELLMLKNPELESSAHAERLSKGLERARDLSHELAHTYQNADQPDLSEKDLALISVQEHIIKNAQPAYDKLMEVYNIHITLCVNMIDEPQKAYLNPVELVRLRENIVSNALAAGATELNVYIEMKATYLVVTFTDNGKGMSQEELDRTILFQHGDGKVHGIGTRSVVESSNKHGYSIQYSSIKGQGTTIRTLVPYCEK